MTMTVNDHQRLLGLAEFASFTSEMPMVRNKLMELLETAKLFPPKQISKTVITMNSRVEVRNLATNRTAELSITYPQDADPRERRVSVFSEIGLELLGRKENDIVSWKVPGGTGQFEVKKVVYQPEAAGDFSL
jgi:regulator of nucleoside diphosphate kinase